MKILYALRFKNVVFKASFIQRYEHAYLQKARVGLYSYWEIPNRGGSGTTSENTQTNPAIILAGLRMRFYTVLVLLWWTFFKVGPELLRPVSCNAAIQDQL